MAKKSGKKGPKAELENEDDYEIALQDGVEDESLKDDVPVKKFQITSYGADYTVDSLVKRMNDGAFKIPTFQRRFVWTLKHSSKFIESLLMGLPVPGIFLYKQSDGKHLVVDGQQRLKTLQAFYNGVLNDKKFRLSGVREPWTNLCLAELDAADRLKLDDSIVHATIFQQDVPADVLDSIYFVFERINSGGIRLSPQEIRNCINEGSFIRLVQQLNDDPNWRAVFGPVNKRAKDQELIVRFLAMYLNSENYSRPMAKFLNDFSDKMNKETVGKLQAAGKIFKDTIALVNNSIGEKAFRPVRSLNAAVFDSVMTGIAVRMARSPAPSKVAVRKAYDKLLASDKFRKGWLRSTADEETVKLRISLATKAFDAT
jgi:uncharacterized protein with ParB-like and HNH nuclease domain